MPHVRQWCPRRRRDEASTTLSEFKLCIASILELIISIVSSDMDGGDHVSGCFPNSVQFSSVIIIFKISLLRRINYLVCHHRMVQESSRNLWLQPNYWTILWSCFAKARKRFNLLIWFDILSHAVCLISKKVPRRTCFLFGDLTSRIEFIHYCHEKYFGALSFMKLPDHRVKNANIVTQFLELWGQ